MVAESPSEPHREPKDSARAEKKASNASASEGGEGQLRNQEVKRRRSSLLQLVKGIGKGEASASAIEAGIG